MIDLRQEILAGNVLIREAEQSQNYVAGVSGWRIAANGDAEFNNIIARGKLITGPPGSKHIEINGVDSPNGIAFYTGDPAELFPSILQPQSEANGIGIQFASPQTAFDNIGSILKLYTHKLSPDSSLATLTTPGFLGLATKSDLQITNVTTGDIFDMNVVGGTSFNGTHFKITDSTSPLGANNGVDITQGYIKPLQFDTWQSITNLSALTGGTAFVNSWTDTAGARFGGYKDAVSNVHLRGLVKSGTAVTIFTLPVGWRPSSNMDFTIRTGTVVSAVNVAPTGIVTVTANFASIGAVGIDLSVVSFPTA